MESPATPEAKYSSEWFKRRALTSLVPLGEHTWDFSDSLLLYTPDADKGYDDLQVAESPYHKLVTAPEHAYIKSIAGRMAAELPEQFDFIDLGPGTEHKEQFFFDALKERGASFNYIPVDISERYLQLASAYAGQQGIETIPMRASFEEIVEHLQGSQKPRFVSIGLTYSNYTPEHALNLLKGIAGRQGYAFINSQLRERIDMRELVRIYEQDAASFIDAKMGLLGLRAGEHYDQMSTDDSVRVWCTITNPNQALSWKGVQAGDVFLIFQSLRPTRESLEKDIASNFDQFTLYDTGAPFVAALLKTS